MSAPSPAALGEGLEAAIRVAIKHDAPPTKALLHEILTALTDMREERERLEEVLRRAQHLIDRAGLASNGAHWEAVMQYEAALTALSQAQERRGKEE